MNNESYPVLPHHKLIAFGVAKELHCSRLWPPRFATRGGRTRALCGDASQASALAVTRIADHLVALLTAFIRPVSKYGCHTEGLPEIAQRDQGTHAPPRSVILLRRRWRWARNGSAWGLRWSQGRDVRRHRNCRSRRGTL